MNCPSRVDPDPHEGWNQNPSAFAADLTTREDFNGRANQRTLRRDDDDANANAGPSSDNRDTSHIIEQGSAGPSAGLSMRRSVGRAVGGEGGKDVSSVVDIQRVASASSVGGGREAARRRRASMAASRGFLLKRGAGNAFTRAKAVLAKYANFVGPGFMVAVAYIDPGNYATDVAAGATYRYRLLFIILMSNIFAIFLQSLCIKLGTVTGMNLAENCKAHLPRWLNYVLYFFAESAIIATDIAEVIGFAIALNVLIKVPLVAGCAISIIDVMIILFFYRPSGSMRGLRYFEGFVALLVLGVVVCFIIQLSYIKNTSVGDVFRGYLPSSAIVQSKGLYQSCGILGATVMPHSLYLGSGIVQPRLREFDLAAGLIPPNTTLHDDDTASTTSSTLPPEKYRPSLSAIQSCMKYSIAELAISLFTFALFVNSAILIVAGSSLYNPSSNPSSPSDAESADLFAIHALLSSSLAPAAGTIFMLALLLSGTSAGIVCTIAGQMVSEGQLNWHVKPWLRRLITRSISIVPSIVIAGAVGRDGLSRALEASQVALSVILPVVSAPLIWFTCCAGVMRVGVRGGGGGEGVDGVGEGEGDGEVVQMRNGWVTAGCALVIWGVVVVMNVALLVLAGLGVA
ncbi:natural resistance-associated macrophage protein [Pseudovirgaria hyperparasitica]|uniref:Natural resistance-associated macrophage protein n=1 Tax=Pseudovirgaria hyperparasitica TaxID=470096 RepID=A0A6A6VW87_9PEZI|nr:natural resistance-associated macrophage protein [Pseudovirgaria hyperparasitica]KAF2753964.1 natural resistance-associated macrophage protein [Pseudovirgaria hyperparasitica]